MTQIPVSNPLIVLYSTLSTILNKVQDINSERRSRADLKARQWIFPEWPEKDDDDYPRLSISFTGITLSPYGADRYIQSVSNGNEVIDQHGEYWLIPVEIGIFVKKEQLFEITSYDNNMIKAKNRKLADYMSGLIAEAIISNRNILIQNNFDFLEERDEIKITPSYEDNSFLFAATVNFNIVALKAWNISRSKINSIITEYEVIRI